MKKKITYILLQIFCVFAWAQDPLIPKTRILFLLDASFSMNEGWSYETKWQSATRTLMEIVDSTHSENLEMGLRVFGHQSGLMDKNCKDTRLEISIAPCNPKIFKRKLSEIKPNGITPLVYSIEKSAQDFGGIANTKNILVLITDGAESCGGDPCSVSLALQQNNVFLKPYVIGLKLDKSVFSQYDCIGKFSNANKPDELNAILKKIVDDSNVKTTAQLNLNNSHLKPTESDVAFTLFDQQNGLAKYRLHHTFNSFGLPDTLEILPGEYRLIVHTTPPILVEHIVIQKNIHNLIPVSASQGNLAIELTGVVSGFNNTNRLKSVIRKKNNAETIFVQRINSTQKFLIGEYDIDVLTLPRIELTQVKIEEAKTTTISVPAPGMLSISKSFDAFGAIFYFKQNQLEKVIDLNTTSRMETIGLQPGKYKLVYRAKFAKTVHTTVDKNFEIISGGVLSLKL